MSMLSLFCDERYEEYPDKKRIIFCCIGVPRGEWLANGESLMIYARKKGPREPQLVEIEEVLNRLNGRAILAYVDVPLSKMIGSEPISLPEIPRIAPWNFLWSVAFSIAIVPVIAKFDHYRFYFEHISVFYDSKSLTESHRTVVEQSIKMLIPKIRQEKIDKFKLNLNRNSQIRRVEETPKPATGVTGANPWQLGVILADRLCARLQFDAVGSRSPFERISISNITGPVFETYDLTLSKGISDS
jgi:hypothetical protein